MAYKVASSCGLLEDEHLREKKVSWLTKHDKLCGGLFGMLPLVRGMPIFLTDHLDRSEKGLLRARAGTLLDWELNADEPQVPHNKDHFLSYTPRCIYVQFSDEVDGEDMPSHWSIAGMPPGVYCISPKSKYWYLDANASYSHMRIKRTQLPVAPNFARTAYSMQGFTLSAGKIDLNVSKHADPATLYVAMSRFRKADDVLILQPFNLDVFQQGVPDQPRLLMACIAKDRNEVTRLMKEYEEKQAAERAVKLREVHVERVERMHQQSVGGNLDGGTAEAKKRKIDGREKGGTISNRKRATDAMMQSCTCKECKQVKNRKEFSERQWGLKNMAVCEACMKTCVCSACHIRKRRKDFPQRAWRYHRRDGLALCSSCGERS